MPDSVYDLRTPWGGRRFYLPGHHPVAARLRAQREKLLEALGALQRQRAYPVPSDDRGEENCVEALAYCEARIAAVEDGEEIARLRAAYRLGYHPGLSPEDLAELIREREQAQVYPRRPAA